MYSSLPVILFIECVLGKRSIAAALTLARNRMLYLTTWKGALLPLPGQVLLYLLPNWCMVCGIVVWSRDADSQRLFDAWEILVMWLVVLMRHFVVAVKYGYLPASEIAADWHVEERLDTVTALYTAYSALSVARRQGRQPNLRDAFVSARARHILRSAPSERANCASRAKYVF